MRPPLRTSFSLPGVASVSILIKASFDFRFVKKSRPPPMLVQTARVAQRVSVRVRQCETCSQAPLPSRAATREMVRAAPDIHGETKGPADVAANPSDFPMGPPGLEPGTNRL